MPNEGRLKVGADADITVFDAGRVTDRATFDRPAQYSEGIPDVMVNGVWVVKNGEIQEDARPGRRLRRPAAN